MLYVLSGFIFGSLIPYMARRFAKFMPATMANALYQLIVFPKTVSKAKKNQNVKYKKLRKKYLLHSFVWGIITSLLTVAAHFCLPSCYFIALIWILLLLYEIDERMLLLPDILTIPLLIIGFVHASVLPAQDYIYCSPSFNAALGAAIGYILPVIASLMMVKKHPDAFGGGDIKLLSATGAWLGFQNVPILLLLSSFVFGIYCLIKRKRAGAFGPAIVIATILLAFFVI